MRHELRWFVSLLGFRDVRRDVIPRLGNFHARRLDSATRDLLPRSLEFVSEGRPKTVSWLRASGERTRRSHVDHDGFLRERTPDDNYRDASDHRD